MTPEEIQKMFEHHDKQALIEKIEQFVYQPDDPEVSIQLAMAYFKQGHYASALSFFLRTAERSEEKLLTYEALLKAAECYRKQGTRKFTVKGLLQQAVTTCPERPEAYLQLSMILEQGYNGDGRWFDAYTIACLGLAHTKDDNVNLRFSLPYPGRYSLLFQKAHTGWHCGLCDQARDIFQDLLDNYELDDFYRNLVKFNIEKISNPQNLHRVYTDGL